MTRWTLLATALLLHCLAGAGHGEEPTVRWVRLQQRNDGRQPEAGLTVMPAASPRPGDEVEQAFRRTAEQDIVHGEKVRRIEKMLNESMRSIDREVAEGRRKLQTLQQNAGSRVMPLGLLAVCAARLVAG